MQVKNSKLFILFFAIIISSCASKKIDDDTLVKIFVEKLIIDEKYYNNKDSIINKNKELFNKYKINEKEFEEALRKKNYNREEWATFFKKSNQLLYDLKNSGAIK